MKTINKGYFLLRGLKDMVGLKSGESEGVEYSEEAIYQESSEYDEDWEDNLEKTLSEPTLQFHDPRNPTKGFIDIVRMRSLLGMKKMEDVYWYYISRYSLANHFPGVPQKNVITTVLMMDLEMGWNLRGKIRKSAFEQIDEIKELATKFPVLPFLACDPRRAEFDNPKENLYSLFNKAFCKGSPFFGVKIYPAMGYYPSDYRLWPIYEICNELGLPIVSHHGGETVSSEKLQTKVFHGTDEVSLNFPNRKALAHELNNPAHWGLVLEKFPNLRLNFGHFGGYETWSSSNPVPVTKDPQRRKETIFGFMEKYPNVYADFSFNLEEETIVANLKNVIVNDDLIQSRTLFGTDFWVVNPAGDLNQMQQEFLEYMERSVASLELPKKLCIDNPKRFLF
jgi:predicted TIM-barrel fold metal-dependent hydrolase